MDTEPTDPSSEALSEFVEGIEHRALEARTEYTFFVEGTEILPSRGAGAAEVLPERSETVIVKMLADWNLYKEL